MPTTENSKSFYIHLVFAGVIGGCAAMAFLPSLLVHAKSARAAFFALQGFGTIAGLATYMYYVLRIANTALVQKINRSVPLEKVVIGVSTMLVLIVTPFLLYDFQRIGTTFPYGLNEGWNVFHTSRLLHGGPLYPPITGFPLTPVNYPPVSFLLVGGLAQITKSLLLTGRMVSLIAVLFVGMLVFSIINTAYANKSAAVLGGLLWLALMIRVGRGYVFMYDPQMLGHVFSTGAVYLYHRWSNTLTSQKIGVLAFLCCLGLFTKPLLVAVPIALGITFFVRGKRFLGTFALAGVVIATLLVLGSSVVFGRDFFTNILVEQTRAWSLRAWLSLVNWVLVYHFCIVLLVVPAMLLFEFENRWMFAFVYFAVSLIVGSYFSGNLGLAQNAWFDFFIAASIVLGALAAAFAQTGDARARIAAGGVLIACLLPGLQADLKTDLRDALDFGDLRYEERTYQADVERLRSIPGPALFENLLLGFDAGKEYLFDPFLGTELIVSGRTPEGTLTDRIRARYFSVVVLDFDAGKALAHLTTRETGSTTPKASLTERWTDNTLIAVQENYELLNQGSANNYFYVPGKH